jgi:putative redox protein
MKVEVESFEVETEGILAHEHPKKFMEIVTRYLFRGKDLPQGKLKRAIQLSQENYCGVFATLAPTVRMRTEIRINDQDVES